MTSVSRVAEQLVRLGYRSGPPRTVPQLTPEEICAALLRKGHRRRATPTRRERLLDRTRSAMEADEPLRFCIPFGGYKHYWNDSAPRVDWAELINLNHMIDYFLPVLQAYKPGVELEYISEDFVVPAMNNYPSKDNDSYADSFRQMLAAVQPLLPPNLDVTFWRLGDRFPVRQMMSNIRSEMPARVAEFHDQPKDEQAADLVRSNRSVKWDGSDDLTSLNDAERHERVIYSRVMEKVFSEVAFTDEFVGRYYEDGGRTCLVFSFGLSRDNGPSRQFLTLQSAHGSNVDFWIGRGVLIAKELRPTIVSHRQYGSTTEAPRAVPIHGLESFGENFSHIDVM